MTETLLKTQTEPVTVTLVVTEQSSLRLLILTLERIEALVQVVSFSVSHDIDPRGRVVSSNAPTTFRVDDEGRPVLGLGRIKQESPLELVLLLGTTGTSALLLAERLLKVYGTYQDARVKHHATNATKLALTTIEEELRALPSDKKKLKKASEALAAIRAVRVDKP